MRQIKRNLASALILMIAFAGSGYSSARPAFQKRATDTREQQTLQICREAVLSLTHCQETEALYKKQVDELKAANSNLEEQVKLKDSAIQKYELAVTARTQAEALVSELRSNYEKQVATAEKLLAVEQGRSHFWKTISSAALVVGVVLGAVIGHSLK